MTYQVLLENKYDGSTKEFTLEALNQTEAQLAAIRHVKKPRFWICHVKEVDDGVKSTDS